MKSVSKKMALITVSCVTVIFVMIVLLVFQYITYWGLKNKQDALNAELNRLNEEDDYYSSEYEYKSSDEFIEDYAHEVIGWGKEGYTYYK